jgi:hypothetical protein
MWVWGSAFCEVRAANSEEARQRIEERLGSKPERKRVLVAWRDDGRPVRCMRTLGPVLREEAPCQSE